MKSTKKVKICIFLFVLFFTSIPSVFLFNFKNTSNIKNEINYDITDEDTEKNIDTSAGIMGVDFSWLYIHELSDAKMSFSVDFYVKSRINLFPWIFEVYNVIGIEVWFYSTSSSGKWPVKTKVFEVATGILGDQVPGDDNPWYYLSGPFEFYETNTVETALSLEVRLIYDYGGLWHYKSKLLLTYIRDDDAQAPVITKAILMPDVGSPIDLKHNTEYDLSAIKEEDYDNWRVIVEVSEYSRLQREVLITDGQGIKRWVWFDFDGSDSQTLLKIRNDNPGNELIEIKLHFRDLDNDRPNDGLTADPLIARINFRDTYGNGPELEEFTKVKVEPFEPEKGLYLTNSGLSTTMITRYKTNGQKNKVSVSLNLQNNDPYPVRVKFGIKVYGIQNVNYKINTDDFYRYSVGENYIYDGGNQINNLSNYFNYDATIDLQNNDETMHFWVELNASGTESSSKTINLLEVEVDSLKLIDDENILTEDLKDLGYGLYGIIPDIKGLKSKFEKLEEISHNLGLIDQKVSDGDLQSDIINWLEIWSQYQNILNSDAGGSFIFGIVAEEAYIAHKEWINYGDKWIWRINNNDENDRYHYTRYYEDERLKLDNLVEYDSTYFKDHPNQPGAKYCGIGFIPGRDQLYAFQAYILAEVLSDGCYLTGGLITSYLGDYLSFAEVLILSALYFIIGCVLDIVKNINLLPIANGQDPPDFNYYEKPDEELVIFPYENFPELDLAINENNPIALEGKEMIDNMLEYEQTSVNLLSSINKFNTSYLDEEFSASEQQTEYINEFSIKNKELSTQIENNYISIIDMTNDKLETDITHFDEEKLEFIENSEFNDDLRFLDFIEDYQNIRDVDDSIVQNYEKKKTVINNLKVDDLELINNATKQSLSVFDLMNDMSDGIIESNTHTKVHVSRDLLGKDPLNDENTILKIEELNISLDLQAQLILDGDYFEANKLGHRIQLEAIQLYHGTYRQEFMEIYKCSYNMVRDSQRANQLDMKLIDLPTKSIINGQSANFDFIIQNLASEAFINTEDNLMVLFNLIDLPSDINYKIYEDGIELGKNNDGYYQCNIGKNEIKKLTLEVLLSENSNLELSFIDFILNATSEGIFSRYSELELHLYMNDDDITPPEIIYEYIGGYNDGNPGYIIVDASDLSGLSLDPSGTYVIPSELGSHEFILIATDADNDSSQDTLTTTETFLITIIDDDILAPQIINLVITYGFDDVLISFDAYDNDSGDDSGLSLIKIYIDQILILTEIPIGDESSFEFSILNQWGDDIGNHDVKIEVWDADNDREQDSLMQEENGSFEAIEKPPKMDIPGYDIVLIFAIVGFTGIFLLIRKRKSIKV